MTNTKAAPAAPTTGAKDADQANIDESQTRIAILAPLNKAVKPYGTAAQAILPLLQSGRNNAQKRRDLLAATGLPDRAFRRGVEALRRAGVVICADSAGYYLPATLGEIKGFIAQEERRARSTFYTLRTARELAAQLQAQGEQIRIEGA